MTKQECLNQLRAITFAPKSQAAYWMACNYYDTVSDLTEDEFDTVSNWYNNELKPLA